MMRTSLSLFTLLAFAASAVHGSFDSSRGLQRAHYARQPVVHQVGRRSGGKKTYCDAQRQLQASLSSAAATSTTPPPPPPTPTPTPQPAPPPPAPKKSDDSNNGGGSDDSGDSVWDKTYSGGQLTFYSPGLNACGTYDKPDAWICAVSYKLWNSWPGWNGDSNDHPLCHKAIEVTYQGKTIPVTITDLCAGCEVANSLDLGPDAFSALASEDIGRLYNAEWKFADPSDDS